MVQNNFEAHPEEQIASDESTVPDEAPQTRLLDSEGRPHSVLVENGDALTTNPVAGDDRAVELFDGSAFL